MRDDRKGCKSYMISAIRSEGQDNRTNGLLTSSMGNSSKIAPSFSSNESWVNLTFRM